MAIYEYKCLKCGNEFEKHISIKKESKTFKCPKCGKNAKKQMSSTSFKLEGGSWAKDGYSNKK